MAAPRPDNFGMAFAGMVLAGGISAYLRAGSTISLVASTVFGLLLAWGARQNDPKVMIAVSGLLLAVMSGRFAKTGKFMPAGLVSVLALVSMMRYGSVIRNAK
ncbi:transmembrane proteins 14C-domain-containing protein [Hyaloraphidium curvatum]|nr:transmembrane proteins 14C-domain-containing protein [Hyaloraphidium curvatum]